MKLRRQQAEATDERIAKLPKWAQEHLRDLTRERDNAEKKLAAYIDDQTESRIYFTDRDGNKVYLNEEASERLTIVSQCGRVHLRVTNYHDDRIELSWTGGRDEYGMGDIAFIPTSYQQARLVHPANTSAR